MQRIFIMGETHKWMSTLCLHMFIMCVGANVKRRVKAICVGIEC